MTHRSLEAIDNPQDPTPSGSSDPSGRSRVLLGIAVALAAVPLVRMGLLVADSGRLQYGDYWHMIPEVLRTDGWLDIGGVFTFRNEHPVGAAKLLYWVNARLFAGSNLSLGVIVILLTVTQLVILDSFARSRLSPLRRAALLVAASALLFALQGGWSFFKAMSGSAWFTANLFALTAIWLRCRGGRYPAMAVAALASLSYGTGLMAWPALLVAGLARDREPKKEWPVLLGTVAFGAWYLVQLNNLDKAETISNTRSVPVDQSQTIVGSIFAAGHGDVTRYVGWAVIVIGLIAFVACMRSDSVKASPWAGLFAYGMGSVAVIAVGRNTFLANFGSSRYSSLAALTCVAVLGLVSVVVRWTAVPVALCVVATLAATLSGGPVVDSLRRERSEQELLGVAIRLGLADGSRRWTPTEDFSMVSEVLAATDHYPYGGGYDADCGLLGERVNGRTAERVRAEVGRVSPVRKVTGLPGAVEVVGRIKPDTRCILMTDPSNHVIGMGVAGYQRSLGEDAPPQAFTAIAPASGDSDRYRVWIVR